MNVLNKNLIKIILDYSYPKYYSDVDNYKIFLNYCSNIDSNFFSNNTLIFNKLLKILKKYKSSNVIKWKEIELVVKNNIIGTKELIDMLCTGLVYEYPDNIDNISTIYNNCIGENIKFLVTYHPECINTLYNVNFLNRNGVPPLFIACINSEIPLDIIKLLKNKTKSLKYIYKTSKSCTYFYETNMIDDLKYCKVDSRYNDILNILKS